MSRITSKLTFWVLKLKNDLYFVENTNYSYTKDFQKFRLFDSRAEARKEKCDDETVCKLEVTLLT